MRAERGAGGGAAGGGGCGAGGPSPCPAPGGRPEPREFSRPGGRCCCRSGSLQVTRGAAPAGPSWAEHAAGRAELGAEWTLGPGCCRTPSSAGWLGPGGGDAGRVGSGTRVEAGAEVTGNAVPGRPGVSSTRDKGRVVEGACSSCLHPGLRLCGPSIPGSDHPACSAPGAYYTWRRGPAPPCASPPAVCGAGDGWAQPGRLAVCPGLKAAPLQSSE